MKRNEDWTEALFGCLEPKKDVPFEWGVNDCALFASDLIEAMTGTDIASYFRGEYDSEKGAYYTLHRSEYSGEEPPDGFNSLFSKVVSGVANENGMEQIEPKKLHRGDLALVEQHEGLYAMGIWVGSGVAVPSREVTGYYLRERPNHDFCWRVPY